MTDQWCKSHGQPTKTCQTARVLMGPCEPEPTPTPAEILDTVELKIHSELQTPSPSDLHYRAMIAKRYADDPPSQYEQGQTDEHNRIIDIIDRLPKSWSQPTAAEIRRRIEDR